MTKERADSEQNQDLVLIGVIQDAMGANYQHNPRNDISNARALHGIAARLDELHAYRLSSIEDKGTKSTTPPEN
ncbi:MAG TPA: hypothetical protein DCG72_12335 [Gammaproteobacteria bacterium]|nr:hypothetical protein [Gammaproteobacteria bacterium]